MTWPQAVKDIIEALVFWGVILALFTDFWENLARNVRGSHEDDNQ